MQDPRLDELATTVRRLRLRAGLTVEQAATEAGLRKADWLLIEAGEHDPQLTDLVAIADATGVELVEVFEAPSR